MANFKMEVGHFFRGDARQGYQAALPTARSTVSALQSTTFSQESLDASFEEARTQFWVGSSNPNPVSFNSAGSMIDEDQAIGLVADALGYKTTYWFDEFATDKFVTSDGEALRWQEVKFYVDENDRSQFNGLWQYELCKIDESKFHILMKRIPRK
jgi:hypothetical protein